jgi:HTH-type transcriptional regulator/antitoxin HigA
MVQGLRSAEKGKEEMSILTEYRRLLTKYVPQPIHAQETYEQALAQLEKLMVPRPNAARSLLIEMLATLIEKYESREYPTPAVGPADMLAKLLKVKGVKPANVAKTTGIPTSTLSNVLAHRRGISKQNAFKLGEYFGLSPIVFLGGPSRKKAARVPSFAGTPG